ncbi:MAG: hypothetical protein LBM25_07635 [Bacteroidales bacterium]|jgi:hypothetical protein|nr:hypothetical protein [Bacteroidales bacterium]
MEFNFLRFWNLLKRDFLLGYKKDIIVFAIFAFVNGIFFAQKFSYLGNMFIAIEMYVLLGFRIFMEYHKKLSRSNILLLPVSNLERYLSVFMRAFIYYPIMIIITIPIGAIIMKPILYLLTSDQTSSITDILFFAKDSIVRGLNTFSTYYVFIFALFFGSIFYKKLAGLKFPLLMNVIMTFSAIVLKWLFIAFFGEWGLFIIGISVDSTDFIINDAFIHTTLIVVSLILLFLAYLRLTEEQA